MERADILQTMSEGKVEAWNHREANIQTEKKMKPSLAPAMCGFSPLPPAYGGPWHRGSFPHTILYNFRLPWSGTRARGSGPKWQAGPWKWGHGVPALKGQKAGAFSLRDSEGSSLLEWVSTGGEESKKREARFEPSGSLGGLGKALQRKCPSWIKLGQSVKVATFNFCSTDFQLSGHTASSDGQFQAVFDTHDTEAWIVELKGSLQGN